MADAKSGQSPSLDGASQEAARDIEINILPVADVSIQNAGAISDYNDMIETSGVPLSEFRKF